MEGHFNPDANPLYYPTDRAEAFVDAMFERTPTLARQDTHAVFVSSVSGSPTVVAIGSPEYQDLCTRKCAYLTGDKEQCDSAAQDLWETITDGTPYQREQEPE